jgi:hypothetical protein
MNNINLATALALLSWPIIALWLYKTRPIGQATLWTILGALMLLPIEASIKFPVIPQLDKTTIPNFVAFVGCMFVLRKPIKLWNGFGLAEILILTFFLSPLISSELNSDEIAIGDRVLPGVGIYDGAAAVLYQVVVLLPFFLGRRVLCSEADTEEILRVLVVAGLVYSLPILLEVRLSPKLNTWVYGYFPFRFDQQVRAGGFRPVVFMGGGLLVSFFMMTTAVAAAAFWRTGTKAIRTARLPSAAVTTYLSAVLVLCKSLGALVYGGFLVPLVRFTKPKFQARIALALVILALLYPTLRLVDVFPTGVMLDLAGSVSTDRKDSLETRFKNEDQLVARASQRFWFGWGRFGRSRVYDDQGNDITLSDGRWINTMGQFGFIGFLAEFGLLSLPVFRAAAAFRFIPSAKEKTLLAALILILAINIVDLLPNSPLLPWTWLIAGALLGRAEKLRAFAREQKNARGSKLSPVIIPTH